MRLAKTIFSHRLLLTAIALLLCMPAAINSFALAGEQQALDENDVQAAYLLNFIRFTTWPPASFQDDQQDIVLGFFGENPLGEAASSLDGLYLKQRRLQVIYLGRGTNPQGCHLIYISESERRHLKQILTTLKGTQALTISSMDNFAAQGGMIQMKKINNRIKLIINVDAVKDEHLELRANLLKIATLIGL